MNLQFIADGLISGSLIGLGAIGITLTYSILRFSNFAHGDTMAMGTMVTILFTWWFQSMGIHFGPLPTALLALPFGIAITSLFVLGTDRVIHGSTTYGIEAAIDVRSGNRELVLMCKANG